MRARQAGKRRRDAAPAHAGQPGELHDGEVLGEAAHPERLVYNAPRCAEAAARLGERQRSQRAKRPRIIISM